jgi:hypothetical protein
MRLAKTWSFSGTSERAAGPEGMGGRFGGSTSNRRYNLTFSIQVRNLLNGVNLGTPVGDLSSPLSGQSTQLAEALDLEEEAAQPPTVA